MRNLTAHDQSVPARISELRALIPQSIALRAGDQEMSYGELDALADNFAAYLTQMGVATGDTVAICMERSFDWIVAALSIMRAGAAYVPLDSAWPDSRVRFAVEDSGAAVLVARGALLDRLEAKSRGVDPFRDAKAIAAAPLADHPAVEPGNLAYVIYTSGSTGVPKGVEITHANLSHLIRWHRDTFCVTQQDRASHLLGLGFDAAVLEIWAHLCAGATLCLADDAVRPSPELIQQWLIRESVTICLVPAVLGARLIAMTWPATTALRLLVVGGDALNNGPAAQLPFKVVNNYGPTECTVVSTWAVLKPETEGAPPIGLPIAGASVYLLNEAGEAVPDGEVGEIYVGGAVVGRGYRNLPELTERSFLPDPFSRVTGARMYRTGDRGLRRAGGEIEFRGRLDRQTKIRGQRVELDEIGNVLAHHPSLDFAAVITHVSQRGENQLVAYILPKEDAPVPTAHELQRHLLRSLPNYMVPAIFVRLHALPLSVNGKIDLTILAQPSDAKQLEEKVARVSGSPIEEKLLAMVRTLLENDTVEAEHSFFLAGGHSFLSMQLVMLVRDAFGVDLTLRQLLEAPTVERLAALVAMKLEADDKFVPPRGVLAPQPHRTPNSIFWVHYLNVDLAKVIGDSQPFFSVVLTAEDFSLLGEKPTLQSIAARLVCKILAIQPNGPYTIGGLCLGGIIAFEIASQLRAVGQEISLLVLVDPPNPSYIESLDSLKRAASYARYALHRALRLGLRTSFAYVREHLVRRLARAVKPKSARTAMSVAQEMAEAAAFAYRPQKYDGTVLLLLASERPPHVNYLPGWQAVITGDLHTAYVDAHHRDLLKAKNARTAAGRYSLPSRFREKRQDSICLRRNLCQTAQDQPVLVQTGSR